MMRITNFYRIAASMLPVKLRRERMIAFCKLLVTPLYTVQRLFLEYREDILYKIGHNGQVCYLQAVLNDTFDLTLRRIRIVDQQRYDFLILHRREEMKEVRLGQVKIYTRNTAMADQLDFVIVVPAAFRGRNLENRLRAVVNYYKLAGKQYTISYE